MRLGHAPASVRRFMAGRRLLYTNHYLAHGMPAMYGIVTICLWWKRESQEASVDVAAARFVQAPSSLPVC